MTRGKALLRKLNKDIARVPPKHLCVRQPALYAALSRTNSPACLRSESNYSSTLYCDDVIDELLQQLPDNT